MFSRVLPFCANKTFLASLTLCHWLVRSYIRTTNLSTTGIASWTFCIVRAFSLKPSMQDVLNVIPVLERFVVLIYDRKREEPSRTFPTADALLRHKKRVAYQAKRCWGQCLVSNPELPSPCEWGWTKAESDA